jgi:uncharacterized protein YyaL (SSP411 family)
MARVKPTEPRSADADDFSAQAKNYAFIKQQLEYWEKQQKEAKEKLFEKLDVDGETDSSGNIVIELSEDIDGIVAVVKQRRVSRKINEERAFELIEEKGLRDTLIVTKEIVDEDALMAALYSDELTEEEIEEMYPQNVVWALVMKKR